MILDKCLITFGVVFGTILGSELDPKSNCKFDRFLDGFVNDFGSFWAAKLWPCWPHFWQKWSEPVGAVGFSSNFNVLFEFSFPSFPFLDLNLVPGADFGSILGRPESILDGFWVDFRIQNRPKIGPKRAPKGVENHVCFLVLS